MACIAAELARQDSRLNAAFQALLGSARPEQQDKLRDTQRKWIAYRDAACALFLDGKSSGTLDRLQAANCALDATEQRATELEALGRQ